MAAEPGPAIAHREWVPVAPTWERDPDAKEPWRQVAGMPALALNLVEQEFVAPAAGRAACVLGVGDGMAAMALAALGASVTVADPSSSLLDMLMVRTRIVGVELSFVQADLWNLTTMRERSFELAYAAQAACRLADLNRFYVEAHRILALGGRLVVNEYHPVRRLWKQQPGHPQARYSYFDRRRRREDDTLLSSPGTPGAELGRYDFSWTVSDHFRALTAAGFRVTALEEVGDVRQKWEIPNLQGLPEQLVLAADRE
ncbi:class I SAM-dependent methyltransferase [candidate division WOR-3 bacterium]|nr:class I SAM-dependent methyltransferase [candidate division WOR-3 bacterium]